MQDKRGKSFITIMIVIAILALVLRIVVEGLIQRNMALNQSNAQATLKLISAAIENYAKNNQGTFPADFSVLTKPSPPYLDRDYISQSPVKGYIYSCPRLEPSGYSCYATPSICKLTGKLVYNVTTGGIAVFEECSKKE
jgi:type II secretory pathway pseudopilin PulG